MKKQIQRDDKGRVDFGKLEYLIQLLIVLSLIEFALETLPEIGPRWSASLKAFEIYTVAIFSVEYLLRLFLSRPIKAYAFSFFGIIDLLAILPFLITTGIDLRTIRAFRLLRLFRVVKLARYSAAVQHFHRAFLLVREELALFGATALILLYLASAGIYHFENEAQPEVFASIFHSMWWAIVTLTTVGYGDAYPITAGGRIFTFFIMILGLGVFAVPAGLFASALSKARDIE